MTESALEFPDERLKLLFVCAHPAIDSNVHTPLMLQTVLRLDAARIAAAFLVQPSAWSAADPRKGEFAMHWLCLPASTQRERVLAASTPPGTQAGVRGRVAQLGGSAMLLQMMPHQPGEGIVGADASLRGTLRRATSGGSYVPLTEQDTAFAIYP